MEQKRTARVSELEFRELTFPADYALAPLLAEKEGVHPNSANEIATQRMAPTNAVAVEAWHKDRVISKHCYGLFAPNCNVPEAVVYVNLSAAKEGQSADDQLPRDIVSILGTKWQSLDKADNACFYSITNTAALPNGKPDPNHPIILSRDTGASPAEELINRTAAHLQKTYGITNAPVTLSPMRRGIGESARGFAQWLKSRLEVNPRTVLKNKELQFVRQEATNISGNSGMNIEESIRFLHYHFNQMDGAKREAFSNLMCDLGAQYLFEAKASDSAQKVLDGVESFHISNGAEIAKIHYRPAHMTTESENIGSLGLMVNYRYNIPKLAQHKEEYKETGVIHADKRLQARHNARMQGMDSALAITAQSKNFAEFLVKTQANQGASLGS